MSCLFLSEVWGGGGVCVCVRERERERCSIRNAPMAIKIE
jgi:hypothetical protein